MHFNCSVVLVYLALSKVERITNFRFWTASACATTKTNAKRSMFHGIMNENEGMQTMHVGRKEVGQKKRANFAACHVVIQLSTVERFLLQLSSDDYPLF